MPLPTKQKSTLSILIHTKNEEDTIEECIRSCGELANEIIVIDMESTDSTVKKAKKLGAKVIGVPDEGYVEPGRQAAIEQVTSDWIFILDADERLTPALRTYIKKYIHQPTHSIVRLPRKNIFFKKWLKHGLMWPDYQVRLFKKGSLSWPKEIHSQPILLEESLDLVPTEKNAIVHHHSISLQQRLRKIEQQAFKENYYASHPDITSQEIMERMTSEFPRRFYENNGYKDGIHGFIHAKLMQYYRFIAFARYWEESEFKEIFSVDELQQLWDTNKQMGILMEENRRLREAKIYKLYNFLKGLLRFPR